MIRRYRHFQPLFLGRDRHAYARIADQIPTDEVRIAAVVRIGQGAFDRVAAYEIEERRRIGEAGPQDRQPPLVLVRVPVVVLLRQLAERGVDEKLDVARDQEVDGVGPGLRHGRGRRTRPV